MVPARATVSRRVHWPSSSERRALPSAKGWVRVRRTPLRSVSTCPGRAWTARHPAPPESIELMPTADDSSRADAFGRSSSCVVPRGTVTFQARSPAARASTARPFATTSKPRSVALPVLVPCTVTVPPEVPRAHRRTSGVASWAGVSHAVASEASSADAGPVPGPRYTSPNGSEASPSDATAVTPSRANVVREAVRPSKSRSLLPGRASLVEPAVNVGPKASAGGRPLL